MYLKLKYFLYYHVIGGLGFGSQPVAAVAPNTTAAAAPAAGFGLGAASSKPAGKLFIPQFVFYQNKVPAIVLCSWYPAHFFLADK